jgi:hypothetical protein
VADPKEERRFMDLASRPSRRAVLGAALGAVAATAASAIELPRPVDASSDGTAIAVGGSYLDAQHETYIKNTSSVLGGNEYNRTLHLESVNGIALWAVADQAVYGSGVSAGVSGTTFSASGVGVEGFQGNNSLPFVTPAASGVFGLSDATDGGAGVRGQATGDASGSAGVWGSTDSTTTGYGVYGVATAATATSQAVGVYGHAQSSSGGVGTYGWAEAATGTTYGAIGQAESATGTGVYGYAPGGGVAVKATSNGGLALRTSGRVKVDKASGVVTIPAGKTSITFTPGVKVVTGAFVLLTPRANLGSRGLWYTTSTTGTITVRVSSAVSANTGIGWLLLG